MCVQALWLSSTVGAIQFIMGGEEKSGPVCFLIEQPEVGPDDGACRFPTSSACSGDVGRLLSSLYLAVGRTQNS